MSMKYKLVQKYAMPNSSDKSKKWYAAPNSEAPLSVKQLARQATSNTTLSAMELQAALELLGEFIPKQLLQGHMVPIPGLGTFRLTFKSDGVDEVKDFKPGQMIHDVRPVFTVSKELREAIQSEVEFEDGGVKVGDVNYATRADYYLATGQATSPGTDGEETTEPDEEETPEPGGGSQGGSGEE